MSTCTYSHTKPNRQPGLSMFSPFFFKRASSAATSSLFLSLLANQSVQVTSRKIEKKNTTTRVASPHAREQGRQTAKEGSSESAPSLLNGQTDQTAGSFNLPQIGPSLFSVTFLFFFFFFTSFFVSFFFPAPNHGRRAEGMGQGFVRGHGTRENAALNDMILRCTVTLGHGLAIIFVWFLYSTCTLVWGWE
ncbi:hypothetical protein J3F84DRAFT_49950 [Trichoderma pleuroticola]